MRSPSSISKSKLDYVKNKSISTKNSKTIGKATRELTLFFISTIRELSEKIFKKSYFWVEVSWFNSSIHYTYFIEELVNYLFKERY